MIALEEIQKLPLHEKLRMMEALWDGIAPQEAELEVPQWHKDILDEREQLIRDGKANSSTGKLPSSRLRTPLHEHRNSRSRKGELIEGYQFYEAQEPGLGSYFLDTLYSDPS